MLMLMLLDGPLTKCIKLYWVIKHHKCDFCHASPYLTNIVLPRQPDNRKILIQYMLSTGQSSEFMYMPNQYCTYGKNLV